MELFRKYLFLGPRGSYHWPRFYVQNRSKLGARGRLLTHQQASGQKHFVGRVYRRYDEEGGFKATLKNHSMRKSTCTRLFRKGVDLQLIKEKTGHKSEAVMLYKKSNSTAKTEVSDMLSVLPREMEETRASQSKMFEREEKSR